VGRDGGITWSDPTSLSGFRLDKYLVTVGRFRQFVYAVLPPDGGDAWLPPEGCGKHAHLNGGLGLLNVGTTRDPYQPYETGWVPEFNQLVPTDTNLACTGAPGALGSGSPTWTPTPGAQESLPITCVNWYEAYAFCIWDGGFLPSAAEWEYVALGGSDHRQYPWGSAPPGAANEYAIFGCLYPSAGSCTGLPNIAPVGTAFLGGARWGQLDMAGEAFEWLLDWSLTQPLGQCTDCADVNEPTCPRGCEGRQTRGGYYATPSTDLTTYVTTPLSWDPSTRNVGIGFRCARSP
jgi:formylglycine-generating enzyme required for sulfatase activity